ncbi:MAG: hypothetical protein K6G03_07430 [Lachnospiraceae bacterium]|nr:hypothetical protein [Lachnospiraceae bacterium]
MTFTSLEFIFVFLPICLAGYYILNKRFRNYFLLAASIIFYACGEPKRIAILLVSILVNYIFGLLLSKDHKWPYLKQGILVLSLVFNFGILFYYKWLMFSLGSNSVTLPLGLSFFTFRTVSYCLDIYWEMMPGNKSLADAALYISFFPQISMGPISRYADFANDLYERRFDLEAFLTGVKRVIAGLFKKLVIADTLVPMITTGFNMEASERSVALAWLCLTGFMIQLYFDFMGYSDIAIGLGSMFGFNLPENFDHPYAATSVTEFWNKWHMTLGLWMKNYIYIPVFRACQSKKISKLSCYMLASLGVWLFAGIWHGVGIKTVIYGLYYYVLIAGEKILSDRAKAKRKKAGIKKKQQTKGEMALSHIYLIIAILIGQLLFRCDSLSQYGSYLLSLLGLSGNPLMQREAMFYFNQNALIILTGILLSVPVVPYIAEKIKKQGNERIIRGLSPVLYGILLVVSIAFAFTGTYRSFVYFQF